MMMKQQVAIIESSIESTDAQQRGSELDYWEEQEERSLVKALREHAKAKSFGKNRFNPHHAASNK